MSIPLTINGAVFEYPENFDDTWGINATGWAQAVTNGMLQRAGGNFPLLADVNFGTSFGVLAKYHTSESANPSTVGTLRLASADPGIGFRNNANTANLVLTTNSSDNLLYNGQIVALSGGGSGSSPTFTNTTLTGSLILDDTEGSPKAVTVSAPSTLSTNWAFKFPVSAGSSGQVLSTDGSGVTSWINAAGGGTITSGTGGNFPYYPSTGTTLSDSGISVITPTFTTVRLSQATNQLSFTGGGGGNQLRTITVDSTTTVGEVWNVPDLGSSQTFAAIGQVQYGFQNAIQVSVTTTGSTSSTSFSGGILDALIVPTSSSNRIKITVTIPSVNVSGGNTGAITLFRNGVNVVTNNGLAVVGDTATNTPVHFVWIDSPATTSLLTYDVQFRVISGGTMQINQNAATSVIILEELR